MTALVFSDVNKSFGGVRALQNLSMSFEPGRIYSVIGPNGAGKSTAINIAAGSYRPTSGSVRIGPLELTRLPKHRIAQSGIARTYQNIRLFDEMTVVENLEVTWFWRDAGTVAREVLFPSYRARRAAERRQVIEKVLDELGLGKLADLPAGQLAYGQQKVVEIARALVMNPAVLMLDEPAAGLNHGETNELKDLIKRLRCHDRIIVLVEHDMSLVMSVSDWIYVLHQGQLLCAGRCEEVQANRSVQEAYLGTADESGRLRDAAVDTPTRCRVRAQAGLVRYRS